LNVRDGKPANALALGEENSSSAAPVAANDLVLITTTHGLLAFARPQQKVPVVAPNRKDIARQRRSGSSLSLLGEGKGEGLAHIPNGYVLLSTKQIVRIIKKGFLIACQ